MIRVVLDSNVYISALLFGGVPRQLIALVENGFVQLYTSKQIQKEVERVLEVKFHWPTGRVLNAANYLWTLADSIEPQTILHDCVDPDDNHVLACAVESRADWILTGDQHLLALHPYGKIQIVTPRQFLDSRVWKINR
ncbi:MAG: putative toxin-antitoxin system toxin component, PIN family [Candidatus Korobacteraceae bacterium]